MHPFWLVLRDVGHYAPLMPVAALLWERAHHREPGDRATVIVGALLVSFLADQAGAILPGNDWWLSYLFAPLQMGLLLVAVTNPGPLRMVGLGLLLLGAVASGLRGPLGSPETVVQVVGGIGVSFLALGILSPYRRAIWFYCLGTIPGLFWMAAFPPTDPQWLWGWGVYQGARVVGLLWVSAVLVRREGSGGFQRHGDARPRSWAVGRPAGDSLTSAAPAHVGEIPSRG